MYPIISHLATSVFSQQVLCEACYVRLGIEAILQCTAYSSHDFGEHGNTRAGGGSQPHVPGA